MKRLLLATALISTLIAPARAVTLNAEDSAMLMAKLSIYDDKCEPVSRNIKMMIDHMDVLGISNAKFIAATAQLKVVLSEPGYTRAFCRLMKENVQTFDQQHPS